MESLPRSHDAGASTALTPSTTYGGHPRWCGAPMTTTMASSARRHHHHLATDHQRDNRQQRRTAYRAYEHGCQHDSQRARHCQHRLSAKSRVPQECVALAVVPMERPAGAVDVARKSYKGLSARVVPTMTAPTTSATTGWTFYSGCERWTGGSRRGFAVSFCRSTRVPDVPPAPLLILGPLLPTLDRLEGPPRRRRGVVQAFSEPGGYAPRGGSLQAAVRSS